MSAMWHHRPFLSADGPVSLGFVEFLSARTRKIRVGDLIRLDTGGMIRYAVITGFDGATRTWSAQIEPDTPPEEA